MSKRLGSLNKGKSRKVPALGSDGVPSASSISATAKSSSHITEGATTKAGPTSSKSATAKSSTNLRQDATPRAGSTTSKSTLSSSLILTLPEGTTSKADSRRIWDAPQPAQSPVPRPLGSFPSNSDGGPAFDDYLSKLPEEPPQSSSSTANQPLSLGPFPSNSQGGPGFGAYLLQSPEWPPLSALSSTCQPLSALTDLSLHSKEIGDDDSFHTARSRPVTPMTKPPVPSKSIRRDDMKRPSSSASLASASPQPSSDHQGAATIAEMIMPPNTPHSGGNSKRHTTDFSSRDSIQEAEHRPDWPLRNPIPSTSATQAWNQGNISPGFPTLEDQEQTDRPGQSSTGGRGNVEFPTNRVQRNTSQVGSSEQ